jgi:hypothetical protein
MYIVGELPSTGVAWPFCKGSLKRRWRRGREGPDKGSIKANKDHRVLFIIVLFQGMANVHISGVKFCPEVKNSFETIRLLKLPEIKKGVFHSFLYTKYP